MLQTEFEFMLPCGYADAHGTLHRQGTMRRATALDEVEALSHPRVRASEAYVGVALLSRVVTRLGSAGSVTPALIEGLFATDFSFLQDLYLRVNSHAPNLVETRCPTCGTHFVLDVSDGAEEH
ncbi:MAG TPA: phage tail assembly protein [Kouleothrix sp.]|uniref:phage tail assembly protein n=1 Tax=Kouleothrix sp. TaxID=2779161 RepID=UPI002C1F4E76|nr:phage tail assembly protein [Kouleothrix sp.]